MLNGFLIGPPASVLVPIQSVLYTVARVVFLKCQSDRVITPRNSSSSAQSPQDQVQTPHLKSLLSKSIQNLNLFLFSSTLTKPPLQLPASAILLFIYIVSLIYLTTYSVNQA